MTNCWKGSGLKQSATLNPIVLSDPLVTREEGIENKHNNRAAKNRKRKERRKYQNKKHYQNTIESCKEHIKNLSNTQLTDEQITLLSRGLKFIPVPVTKENLIRRQLLADFNEFARRMRLQYIFYVEEKEPHPFHIKSNWNPPVQPSVALETFLEEVRFELATFSIEKPKDNLSHGERHALKELLGDSTLRTLHAETKINIFNPNLNVKMFNKGVQTYLENTFSVPFAPNKKML